MEGYPYVKVLLGPPEEKLLRLVEVLHAHQLQEVLVTSHHPVLPVHLAEFPG